MSVYDIGDRVQPAAVFGADQAIVTAAVRAPDGTTTNYSGVGVVHDGVGLYHVDYLTSHVGEHEWRFTGDHDVQQGIFDVRQLLTAAPPDQLQPRGLCTLVDVVRRVPGYEVGDDGETDEILNDLILRESRDFVETTGREIVAMNADTVRTFDLTFSNVSRRRVRLGDAGAVTQVELFDYDETSSLGVIAAAHYVLDPRLRDDWEPIRWLRFPYRPGSAIMLAPGRVLKVTATWGFPAIPKTVSTAVASLVIWRYLNDVAAEGTSFADAVNRADFNFAQALRVALDARDRLANPPFA